MSHMVIFQTPEGSPGYKQFDSLDEAVAFVEELRNERGVTNARMFALEEIKFELKPVFKVEVQALTAGSAASATPPAAPAAPAAAAPAAAPAPQIHAEPVAAPAPPPPGGAPGTQEQAAPEAPAPAAAETAKEQPARRGLFGR